MFGGFLRVNLVNEMTYGVDFHAGYFIRWSVALRPTNGETVNSQGAGSAQAPTNPHSNGRIK